MGRGGGGSGGSHGGGGGHFNYGICRVLWRHRRQKRTQEILNTPLDELADSVLKKYGEEDDE